METIVKAKNYKPDDYVIVNNHERSPKLFIDEMDKFCDDLNTIKKPKKPYTLVDIFDLFRTKTERYKDTELVINKKNFKKLVDVLFKSLPKLDQKKGAYIKLVKNIKNIKFPDDNFIVKMKATFRGGSRRVCTYDCCKSYTHPGNGQKDRCIAHGGGNICTHINCKNSAVPGNGQKDRCVAHGGGDRCEYLNCKNSAVSGNGNPDRCVSHGGGNLCKHLNCKSSARSGNGKPDRCVAHGGGNLCKHLNCKTSAQSGNGEPDRCVAHGGGNICPNCLNSQSLLNYKRLCRMCFKEAYPDDPKSKSMRNYTYHEKFIKTYFKTNNCQFIHNTKIHRNERLELTTDDKISYRIDFRKLINNNKMICVEIDEHSGHWKTYIVNQKKF
jgi:hypothetical protein